MSIRYNDIEYKVEGIRNKYARKSRMDDEDGHWITTGEGNHVFINGEGEPTKGNPYVIAAMKGESGKGSDDGIKAASFLSKDDKDRLSRSAKRQSDFAKKPFNQQQKEFNKTYKEYKEARKMQRQKARTGEDLEDGSFENFLDLEWKMNDQANILLNSAYESRSKGGPGVSSTVYENIQKASGRNVRIYYGVEKVLDPKYRGHYPGVDDDEWI